jgi:hypothetical protein
MIQAIATVLDFAPEDWSPSMRIVAIALADRVNSDWEAWPSIADISRRTGLSERMVQYNIRDLEQAGVIERLGQKRNRRGQPVSNLWKWRWALALGVQPTAPLGVQPVAPPSLTGGVQPIAPKPLVTNHHLETGSVPRRPSLGPSA